MISLFQRKSTFQLGVFYDSTMIIKEFKIIEKYSKNVVLKPNSIKARHVGPTKDIDLILQFIENTTICECHKICDEIEKQICILYPNCSISIHAEPICYRRDCQKSCIK